LTGPSPQTRYEVWYYIKKDSATNSWDTKTKYKLDTIKNNPNALSICTIEYFHSVKFTLTRTSCMRKEALKRLRQIMQQDQNYVSPPPSSVPSPDYFTTSFTTNTATSPSPVLSPVAPSTPRVRSPSTSDTDADATTDNSSGK